MSTSENEKSTPECAAAPSRRCWIPALIIVAAAIACYGSYLRYWFNPHDEGGTVCLIAQRLMQGERPWVDVALGYNAGWFYPLVALFHITGVNYLAARAFFFALSTITALLGFGIVKRATGSRWLGLAAGLALVVLPGSQFKNYIPLAEAANTACLIHLLHVVRASRRKWIAASALAGAVLGLTALVRVEIAILFAAIWILLLPFVLLDTRLPLAARGARMLLAAIALAAACIAAQAPAYLYLRSLGVGQQMLDEVPRWIAGLRIGLSDQIGMAATAKTAAPPIAPPPAEPAPAPIVDKPRKIADRDTLQRQPVSAMLRGQPLRTRVLAFLTYAPLAGFAFFLAAGLASLVRSVWRREFTLDRHSMKWLILIGGSLSTFPQYFFFRPDRPHISEFMPGYIIAMSACAWLLWPHGEKRSRLQMLLASAFASFFILHLATFAIFAFQHPSAGTIAARFGRQTKFAGDNGVRVRAFKREAQTLTTVRDAVLQHSRPDDFLICYPYMPGYNVMTNRRTYLHNVYVDNATHDPDWAAQSIREFEQKQPAVIVIDNRAINGTEASRFSRWAAPVYDYVKIHYARIAEVKSKDESIEVYAKSFTPIAP
jgi:hypothetical protein